MLHGGTFFVPNGRRRVPTKGGADKRRSRKSGAAPWDSLLQTANLSAASGFPAASAAPAASSPPDKASPRRRGRRGKSHRHSVPLLQMQSAGPKGKETGKDSDRGGRLDPYLHAYSTVPPPSAYPPKETEEMRKRKRKQWLPDNVDGDAVEMERMEPPAAQPAAPPPMLRLPLPIASLTIGGKPGADAVLLRSSAAEQRCVSLPMPAPAPSGAVTPPADSLVKGPLAPFSALQKDESGIGWELRSIAVEKMKRADRLLHGQRKGSPPPIPSPRVQGRVLLERLQPDPESVVLKPRTGRDVLTDARAGAQRWGRPVRTADIEDLSSDEDVDPLTGMPRLRSATAIPYRQLWRTGVFMKPTGPLKTDTSKY